MSEKGGKAEEKRDCRVEFLQDFTLKSMRLKIDKWNKIVVHDEQRQYLQVVPDNFLSCIHLYWARGTSMRDTNKSNI